MPDFWEFPTVSMGLSPLMAIYQARFNRYLENRGLKPATDAKVWAFLGDGETDEPESLGAITLASRENLDNLIFVINCNLQRLDGPVRGNGQIIQELESAFRGARWNVIKVLWGSEWDPILERDTEGLLVKRMGELVDGEYQKLVVSSGAYVREHFFGSDPRLLKLVEPLPDEALRRLRLGGHDPRKVYAAYKAAVEHKGGPTVILARTIKGYGLGEAGEGKNVTHQQKKLNEDELREFRSRFGIPLNDEDCARCRSIVRRKTASRFSICGRGARRWADTFRSAACARSRSWRTTTNCSRNFPKAATSREVSTTMAFVGMLRKMLKDPEIGKLIVPIVPDEARTFGMESLFRTVGIYSSGGQKYEPVDMNTLLLLQGSEGRADSGRGNYRSGFDGVVHRGGHRVRDARNQHHSVFHLLLDVRFPAHRRFHLGRGGHAHARLLAGRHRGTHDALRRRVCSTRTATAMSWRCRCRT